MIKIDIISDAVCPWCYIGKNRLYKAIKNFKDTEFNISWHPFQLNPEMPEEGIDRQLYLSSKFGGSERAANVYNQIKLAGKTSGIGFEFEKIQIMPNSLNAHVLIEYSKKFNKQNNVADELFKLFFVEGKNIGDIEILKEVAKNNNLKIYDNKHANIRNDIKESVINSDISSRAKGISGVPFFIINKSYAISGAQENEVFEKVFETCLINN